MAGSNIVIVGAGIVGLATTACLEKSRPDSRITLGEKEAGPGRGQTGHSSLRLADVRLAGILRPRFRKSGAERTKRFWDIAFNASQGCDAPSPAATSAFPIHDEIGQTAIETLAACPRTRPPLDSTPPPAA